jgi:hypothetical protein
MSSERHVSNFGLLSMSHIQNYVKITHMSFKIKYILFYCCVDGPTYTYYVKMF